VDAESVGLTAIDGVGERRADRLAGAGLHTPGDVAAAGVSQVTAAGLREPIAERIVEHAGNLPAVEVEWTEFPATVERGDNTMAEVTVRSTAGSARAGVRVTVNGVEMTATTTYLGRETLPVGVFGADEAALEFAVEVVFPGLPLAPVVATKTVEIGN
jgi:hypothetical protein